MVDFIKNNKREKAPRETARRLGRAWGRVLVNAGNH